MTFRTLLFYSILRRKDCGTQNLIKKLLICLSFISEAYERMKNILEFKMAKYGF